MVLPTDEELVALLSTHVDAAPDLQQYIEECVAEAVAFIESRAPNDVTVTMAVVDGLVVESTSTSSPLGDVIYQREVLELGSELFYRRQARNGVVSVTPDGNPIRVSADPWKAAAARLYSHRPWGFA